MEAAKAVVSKLTNNRGEKTQVDETVAPAVTSETIKPHKHEEVTRAVDREVHQDHYHTTVQPIKHHETLPAKHSHVTAPLEEREFQHGDTEERKKKLASEMNQFKNESTTEKTRISQEVAPTVVGEHVHHHVHETVQPVIHKETIQPQVIHTTVPVHEVHHRSSQHHETSQLPMKTMEEFKKSGGDIDGRGHSTHQEYIGAPKSYNQKLQIHVEEN